jgi:hypothetical protein
MTSKPRNTPRPPERDYSHRSLLDKLGVKSGLRISVEGISDAGFLQELRALGADLSVDHAGLKSDLIFFGANSRNALDRLGSLKELIQRAGAIWVVYPKGQQTIREIDVIAAGKAAGLVDNKVVRFSDTHTALRLVIPIAQR